MFVEGSRLIILRSDKERADSGDVGGPRSADQCVFEKALPDSQALLARINGKARQDHDRDRMASQSLPDPFRRHPAFRRADGKAIIANDAAASRGDVGLSAVGLLTGKSKLLEKPVQFFAPAVERLRFVIDSELFDRRKQQRCRVGHSNTLGLLNKASSRGLGVVGASSAARKQFH